MNSTTKDKYLKHHKLIIIISSTDNNGGEVSYTYFSNGQPKEISVLGSTVSMLYDDYGRQEKLTDPDAGPTEYSYNAFGELEWQKDARENIYSMTYDLLGRLETKTGPEGITSYSYYSSGNGIEQLASITGPNNISKSYTYDTYGRTIEVAENIQEQNFLTGYEYDEYGNNIETTYPSGFSVTREYDQNGYLNEVKRGDNGNSIWKKEHVNALGQPEQYLTGLGARVYYTYDNTYGFLQEINSEGLNDFEYDFNIYTGNLNYRKDKIRNITEYFQYDNLNRLDSSYISGLPSIYIEYESNGNISFKTDAGDYSYDETQKHALVGIDNNPGTISDLEQNITYTSFNKIKTIWEEEGGYEMLFDYGPGQNRKKVQLLENSNLISTKYYSGNYEKKITGSNTQEVHYLAGGDGLAAMYIIENGNGKMYYVFKDHLGTITAIIDENVSFEKYFNYDAWGRRRNQADWSYNNVPTSFLIDRGFTGHEHMDEFGLINMFSEHPGYGSDSEPKPLVELIPKAIEMSASGNGRVYDPVLGRFLSPDNYVQMPDFSQNFNRYSYVLNNPLLYTDPDGEIIFSLAAAIFCPPLLPIAIGTDIGWISGGIRGTMTEDMTFWDGAWRGGVVGAVGGLMAPIGGAGMTFGANLGLGIGQGAVTGGLDAALWGNDIGNGMLWGTAAGAVFTTLTSENFKNLLKGENFLTNEKVFTIMNRRGMDKQAILNYFGFDGKYIGSEGQSNFWFNVNDYSKFGIRYTNEAFVSYDALLSTYTKESFSLQRFAKKGIMGLELADFDEFTYSLMPEERLGAIHIYKNQGLYKNDIYNFYKGITNTEYFLNMFNNGLYNSKYLFTPFKSKWWHRIYKIPRRW